MKDLSEQIGICDVIGCCVGKETKNKLLRYLLDGIPEINILLLSLGNKPTFTLNLKEIF